MKRSSRHELPELLDNSESIKLGLEAFASLPQVDAMIEVILCHDTLNFTAANSVVFRLFISNRVRCITYAIRDERYETVCISWAEAREENVVMIILLVPQKVQESRQ